MSYSARFFAGLGELAALLAGVCFLQACSNDSPEVIDDVDTTGIPCTDNEECDDGQFCNGQELCRIVESGEMRCISGKLPCVEFQTCLEKDNHCRTECSVTEDADGDGSIATDCGGDDCDDSNPSRYPGNLEVCDAYDTDEDCEPKTVGFMDIDGDEFISARCCNITDAGRRNCGNDCDDEKRSVNPSAQELCDGIDNDCNGDTDDLLTDNQVYLDTDGDGFGDSNKPQDQCSSDSDVIYSTVGGDCDDSKRNVNPAQSEICDGVDNDCDGEIDEGVLIDLWEDNDKDNHGDPTKPTVGCVSRRGVAVDLNDDCDDDNRHVHPDAFDDSCDGLDNDCDGETDEDPDVIPIWYLDQDGDGYGDISQIVSECVASKPGYGRFAGDCNDSDPSVYPGAPELCDRKDNDCGGNHPDSGAGGIDEREDVDNDGHAATNATCLGEGAPFAKDDCDDADAARSPSAAEICDGQDNDCVASSAVCSYFGVLTGPVTNFEYVYSNASSSSAVNCTSFSGKYLTGIQDRRNGGNAVVSLNPYCSNVTPLNPQAGNESTTTSNGENLFNSWGLGTTINRYCGNNEVMTGVGLLFSVSGLSSTYPRCGTVTLSVNAAPTVSNNYFDGTGGVQLSCPDETILRGLRAFDADSVGYQPITRVIIECQQLQGREY